MAASKRTWGRPELATQMNVVLSSWLHMALDANVTLAINYLKQQYSTPASEE